MSGDPKDGGWAPCRPAAWLRAVEMIPRPLSEDEAQTDLWVLNDVARQKGETIPGYRSLAARWGWAERPTRALVAGTPKLCLSSRGARRNGVAIVPQSRRIPAAFASHSEPANAEDGENPSRSRRIPAAMASQSCRNCVAPLLDDGVSSDAFDGPQKQTTEAEDRETSSLVTTPSEVAIVPQAAAAPAALGPADPASDEPDWDALLTAVPMTYDEEADDDRGAVDPEADSAAVGAVAADRRDAPPEVAEAGDNDPPCAQPARSLRAAALGGDAPTDAVLTLPLGSATQPPPATRATDVDALWEAWRAHGTVRGKPNPKRRGLLTRAVKAHGLPTMLDLLAAAHTGAGDYWRHLQGATPRNDTPYLSPETLLNSRRDERVERAAAWVAAGRPTHDVAETRTEARAQAVARPAKERALAAWDRVPEFAGLSLDQAKEAMAKWPAENQRAMLAGLDSVGGLSTLGRLDSFARQRKKGDFVRGVVEALGGRLTEAELREVS